VTCGGADPTFLALAAETLTAYQNSVLCPKNVRGSKWMLKYPATTFHENSGKILNAPLNNNPFQVSSSKGKPSHFPGFPC
jgi:hypothetical protein